MKIKHLEYEDKSTGWKLSKTSFSELNLLVGVSGVGKTRILNALWQLRLIALSASSQFKETLTPLSSPSGVTWDIGFETEPSISYHWSGEFESIPSSETGDLFQSKKFASVEWEHLTLNGETIIERNKDEIILRGSKTPRLSSNQSVLSILSEEEGIKPAHNAFQRIIQSDFSRSNVFLYAESTTNYVEMLKRHASFQEIQESELESWLKMGLLYYGARTVFDRIKERFIEIFPQVEDVRVERSPGKLIKLSNDYQIPLDESPELQIKERGIADWIPQGKLSSGMFKTFMHIAEMYLWPPGTVILIDEFENSLGVNCINFLTEDLIEQDRGVQFIITSHHPYIINSISPKYWKLVTRDGNIVTTHDASELHLSDSHHSAFIQLINLEEFKEGIAIR